jgi:hypothetical protein
VVSTSIAPRRLTIPAARFTARETLVTTVPFYLRAPGTPPAALPVKQVSPPLLSFDGSTFMDDLLATVSAGNTTALPELLAWRDWAEPPSGMLNILGAPLYPASIVRAPPLHIAPEQEAPGTLDADGVPHGVPAWLRKLYMPLHLRFNFVAFDVVCMRAGWPMLDKARVKAAAAVVRRLVRDPSGERWEDWLSADGKTGLWFELHGGLPADPDVIPSGAYRDSANQPQDAAIAARLGLPAPGAQTPLTLKLDSTKLTVLPPTAGDSASHCSIYGLLPVFSAAQQASDDVPETDPAKLAQAFHDHAITALTADWADDAGLRAKLGPALQNLLDRTILPTLSGNVATATNTIRLAADAADPFHNTTVAEIQAQLPLMATAALRLCRTPPGVNDADPAVSLDSFWTNVHASLASTYVTIALTGLNATRTPHAADWNVLVIDYLRRLAQTALTTTGVPSGDAAIARALLAVALIRLRTQRLALLASLQEKAFGSTDRSQITLIQPQTFENTSYNLPVGTTGGLGAEIEAILQMDAIRTPPADAPTWPPLDLSNASDQIALHAHQAAVAVEQLLVPVDAAGADGGSAYETQVDAKAATAASDLILFYNLTASGAPLYRTAEAGLELREQPARGLLAFPGAAPQASTFSSMTTDVANSYTATSPMIAQEASGREKVHRLRYDHASLYAVWCWVRVAGRDPCENDQLVWTARTEPFAIAEPSDVLGAKPASIQLPDLPRLIRDIPRIAKARAKPFAAFNTPPNSSYNVGDDPKKTTRAWGVGWICSFAIPVLTICAFIIFSIIFSILIILPSFSWMLLLKFCIPIPVPKKS